MSHPFNKSVPLKHHLVNTLNLRYNNFEVINMSISKENTRIQVTLPKELKEKLEKKAKENNRSVSNYVVKLIQADVADSSPT